MYQDERKVVCRILVASSASVSGKSKALSHLVSTSDPFGLGYLFFKVSCNSEPPVCVVGCSVGHGPSQVTLITWPLGLAALLKSRDQESCHSGSGFLTKTESLAVLSVAQHW